MPNKILGLLIVSVLLLVNGCRKDPVNPDGQVIVEGTIRLQVNAIHHTWGVPGIRVYLKKNATEFPGYDPSVYEYNVQADNEGVAQFGKLYPGKYFVYARGWDYYWGDTVLGYTPVVLTDPTRLDNTMTLYVSE
jgi:hypothetical protein